MLPSESNSFMTYKAMTLLERANTIIQHSKFSPNKCDLEAKEQLLAWRSQPPFNNRKLFIKRLTLYNLTEKMLLKILSDNHDVLNQNEPKKQPWFESFVNSFDRFRSSNVVMDNINNLQGFAKFLVIVEPLLQYARNNIRNRIQLIIKKNSDLLINVDAIDGIILQALSQSLINIIIRTMTLELNIARLGNLLTGATSQERFLNFIDYIKYRENAIRILHEYPVLSRLITERIDSLTTYIIEFFDHLYADWDSLKSLFNLTNQSCKLVEINMGAGDTHHDGRSVIIVSFDSGLKLVYKPRSLAVEKYFQEFLKWLNGKGMDPSFQTIKILDRNTYGWTEFVNARSCESTEEIKRFYKRQGGYLAALYILEATDFHFENLIASGEHPMLIDLESLFHPRFLEGKGGFGFTSPTAETLNNSLLRIGLLPIYFWSKPDKDGIDISGLGGKEGQILPFLVPYVDNINTDEMKFTKREQILPGTNNRPKLNGNDIDTLEFANDIVNGFTNVYNLLIKNRNELLGRNGPLNCFKQAYVRVIVRPTFFYSVLLHHSYHPDFLRDALDRERFLDRLWISVEQIPKLARVIKYEQHDLLKGDIPIFLTTPDSKSIRSASGHEIKNFSDKSGFELVRNRISKLKKNDIHKHHWFIKASLAVLTDEKHLTEQNHHVYERSSITNNIRTPHTSLMRLASYIGDRLCELAINSKTGTNWLSLALTERDKWVLLPSGIDLYNGLPGIILFLSYLHKITGVRRYKTVAESAYKTLHNVVKEIKSRRMPLVIGAFSGWGGIIYLLSHLFSLWDKPELLKETKSIVNLLPDLIQGDKMHDIIGGAAGCICSLLSLYRCSPSDLILDTAIKCGDSLIKNASEMIQGIGWLVDSRATKPFSGFSHGAAGIAFSLCELYCYTKEHRFLETAKEAIKYERSLFTQEQSNWIDLRSFLYENTINDINQPHYATTWCHGAPGIGLARMKMLKYFSDNIINGEIHIALDTTRNYGFGLRNHCLCHGELGNLELFLTASQIYNKKYLSDVEKMTSDILNSINQNGWQCATPLNVETPSFMVGLAGIGYQLLRIARPALVPSVLSLEPPFHAD